MVMKRENYYKLLYAISIILLVAFIVSVAVDYHYYNSIATSAPFYVSIIIRGFEFVIPAIIMFVVGIICKKKMSKK